MEKHQTQVNGELKDTLCMNESGIVFLVIDARLYLLDWFFPTRITKMRDDSGVENTLKSQHIFFRCMASW